MTKTKNLKSKLKILTEELLALLTIDGTATVEESESEEGIVYEVHISAQRDAGLLIGGHGAALTAIQSFLSMALRQTEGDWERVVVDVDGWREKQESHLIDLAKQSAERARTTGEPQNLYNLSPAQRRVIHMALKGEDGIVTESEGEGDNRYLVIKSA